MGTKFVQDFDRFYKQSYLEKQRDAARCDLAERQKKISGVQHFHRPDNFSYSKVRTDFSLPKRGMLSALGDRERPPTKGDPYKPTKNQEAVKSSKLRAGHPDALLDPIERDDWPGPPCPAAAFPELFYDRAARRRHKSEERILDSKNDTTDGKAEASMDEGPGSEEEEEEAPTDPKTDREVQTLTRISSDSGAAKVILQEIQKTKKEGIKLDPISASRTPSASKEPPFATRYENPVFASPKPGYGLAPKGSALSPGGTSNGDPSFDDDARRLRLMEEDHHRAYYSESEVDPTTGLRRKPRTRVSYSVVERTERPFTNYRRSVPAMYRSDDEPPKIFPYEQLLITNPELPAGVERNTVENHLSDEEFDSIFQMSRSEFHRLAEWKRCDLKKRVNLF
eukprot:GHVO01000514.1.p1 GENE.GHVO01000514.1~~GHVO01000514.1.p1  ORF type:complete len:463 (+),score=66.78 GHVO01000514.1:206-1390(+)